MVIKEDKFISDYHPFNHQSLCSFSEATYKMESHPNFENLTSPESITNRHSPSLDDKSNGYYSTDSPPNDFQRSGSHTSLSGTISPQEFAELRSPIRQEAFFAQNPVFDPSQAFQAQQFGVFGGPASTNMQSVGSNIHMNSGIDIKSPLEIKANMQGTQPFYGHDMLQQPIHGGQLPSVVCVPCAASAF